MNVKVSETPRTEFTRLIEELSGFPIYEIELDEDNYYLIPIEAELNERELAILNRICKLANHECHSHFEGDDYIGMWVLPPRA
jgi:hypothetical protein